MQRPLQITIRDFPESEAIETHIREKVEKITQFYSHIVGCHVVVEIPHKHKHQGKLFNVRIDVKVPGGEVIVNRDYAEDMYVALRDAFDAVKRALDEYGEKQRGDVKFHEQPLHGVVTKLLEEGYGFIETQDGDEIYFNRANVVDPDFDRLAIGDEVQFIVEAGGEGLQARRVSVGKHGY